MKNILFILAIIAMAASVDTLAGPTEKEKRAAAKRKKSPARGKKKAPPRKGRGKKPVAQPKAQPQQQVQAPAPQAQAPAPQAPAPLKAPAPAPKKTITKEQADAAKKKLFGDNQAQKDLNKNVEAINKSPQNFKNQKGKSATVDTAVTTKTLATTGQKGIKEAPDAKGGSVSPEEKAAIEKKLKAAGTIDKKVIARVAAKHEVSAQRADNKKKNEEKANGDMGIAGMFDESAPKTAAPKAEAPKIPVQITKPQNQVHDGDLEGKKRAAERNANTSPKGSIDV